MATKSLRLLLQERSVIEEDNQLKGEVFEYTPWLSTNRNFCWKSPSSGTVIVESWGAGGGGNGINCCGSGIPGNSGAYSRKTFNIDSGGYVCGVVGAGRLGPFCESTSRACASYACVYNSSSSALGSICSQGGFSGKAFNLSGSSLYCRFLCCGYSATQFGSDGCGIVCNYLDETTPAKAFGGDVNVEGGISKVCATNCCNFNPGRQEYIHTYPAGIDGDSPGYVRVCYCSNGDSYTRGEAAFETAYLKAKGKPAIASTHFSISCGCVRDCGCYCYGCNTTRIKGAGYGSNIADGGVTNTCGSSFGGDGSVRIRFIAD